MTDLEVLAMLCFIAAGVAAGFFSGMHYERWHWAREQLRFERRLKR